MGATDSDESKPKNLTTVEKRDVFANNSGWVSFRRYCTQRKRQR